MIVPGLGRHLFSGGTAAAKGVNVVIAKRSYLDLRDFKVPRRKDDYCCTLDHFDLTTAAQSQASETAFPTVFRRQYTARDLYGGFLGYGRGQHLT